MLVLTRMAGEKIAIIDQDTKERVGFIQVVGWNRKGVRLGFEFSDRYLILREELLEGGKAKEEG